MKRLLVFSIAFENSPAHLVLTLTIRFAKTMEALTCNVHSESDFIQAYGGRKPESYTSIVAELVRQGKPGITLDLGAGTGLLVELCKKWGLEAIGLEGSPYAVAQAVKRVSGIKFLQHDLGEPLPFRDQSISNIILNQVIEHIDHRRFTSLMSECYRVLEIKGVIFIYSPSKRNVVERSEPRHINMMLPSHLKLILQRMGFTVLGEPNYGFWFMPSGPRLTNSLAQVFMRVLPHDWFSATTNIVACKP